MKENTSIKKLAVGGQAVMEGVMMRSKNSLAVACRVPTGGIIIKEQRWKAIGNNFKLLKKPFLRGGVVLVEALLNGLSALTFSANMQIRYENLLIDKKEEEIKQKIADGELPADTKIDKLVKKKEEELTGGGAVFAITISIIFALGLFVALPHLLASLLGLNTATLKFHLVDGIIKIGVLLAYLFLIGFMDDIKRVFMYHGGEHKAIFTYESGDELTVENARKHTRFHPRCGTSFLFIVLAISILVFSLTLQFKISDIKILDNFIKIFIKIPMMFPIAGISYELLKFSGKHSNNFLLKPFIIPGLYLQRLTTKEPDDEILEVALASLKKCLWREANLDAPSTKEIEEFKTLEEIPNP
jgi:uncharacterized protein YqhQ